MIKENIEKIRGDNRLRDEFIKKYKNFILSSASKALGRYIDESDDAYSTAMIAFNEAITKYDTSKGNFFSFAALVIKSRLIDETRKADSKLIPFSSLSTSNSDGDVEEFDVIGEADVVSDTALEFAALKSELEKFGITILDIPKDSPKSKKTKHMVFDILMYITKDKDAKDYIFEHKSLPAKLLMENAGATKKLLERHRKYIITAVVVLTGDYPTISQYILSLKEV